MTGSGGPRWPTRVLTALLLCGLVTGCPARNGDGIDPNLLAFKRSTLTVQTVDGDSHHFDIFLATSPEQRATGLMHVRHLAPDAGMLFFFEFPRQLSFYMKNTLLPLDMLFIDSEGGVINIARDTVPGSLESVKSTGRARAVLELNAGTSARLKITPGARVRHAYFE